ncbi:major facilitator superfamily domain-containing protein [Piptocephalis cylindrospora]|uniref:Lysosomal dipeptide transporter MFSD1 n=1 Tax=Piptocephalis cylindrospora TaxID=1907219 RepID=A0A4P9Y264_9FUNG|nr:major facilitator superfamily domain-containing protein [Piptocephalis cylindrospora]|eukprot:RKP12917.1 major facilitator superfamily domain-containing protein [Piptocephalis cylindrospora]
MSSPSKALEASHANAPHFSPQTHASPSPSLEHQSPAGLTEEDEDQQALEEAPVSYKLIALTCALLLSAGSHFVVHSLNTLKATLKAELPIDNAQYGVLQSTNSLINSIIPLLGGVLMDRFGTGAGSILCTGLILLGSGLTAIAAEVRSYGLMLMARVLFGMGSGTIVVAQESILSTWFRGKGLAMTIGLQIATSRLFGFLAHASALPIKLATGHYGTVLWVAFALCLTSFTLNLVYLYVHRLSLRHHAHVVQARAKKPHRRFSLSALLYIPGTFWLVPLTIALLSGVWMPFLAIVSDYMTVHFGSTDLIAAWTSSVSLAIPVILSPFCGFFFDRFGRRGPVVLLSALLLVLAISLLGWSHIHPLIGLTLFSLSLTLAPVALTTSVPLILPTHLVGTGLGIYKCAHSSGIAFVDVLVGSLQDGHGGSYDPVLIFFLVLASVSSLSALAYWLFDGLALRGLLDAGPTVRANLLEARRKQEVMDEEEDKNSRLGGPKRKRNMTSIIGTMLMMSFLVLCWITYLVHIIR